MPRKYHRPPSAKRRKGRKATKPKVLEPLPESQTDHSASVIQHPEPAAEEQPSPDVFEDEEEEEEVEELPAFAQVKRRTQTRHLVADYSYVLADIRLAIGLAVVLIIALVITGILR